MLHTAIAIGRITILEREREVHRRGFSAAAVRNTAASCPWLDENEAKMRIEEKWE
jgi:hypothetical protein